MSWKKLLESVSESLNDYVQLCNDYLMAENRILRNQIDGRVQLTDSDRKELAEIGAQLGKKALGEIATVATPNIILAWDRKFADQKVEPSDPSKSAGRPRVDLEKELVIRMARENRSWGYGRFQGALNHLGYTISDQTVGNILKRHDISPAPERKKTVTWRKFTRSHLVVLLATDFFNSDAWNWFGLIVSYLMRAVHFGRHQVQWARITLHRQIQVMRALTRRCPNLIPHGARGMHVITGRAPAVRLGKMVGRLTVSESVCSDVSKPHSQEMSKVVVLFDTYPRLIRDGPSRRQQRLGDFLMDNNRKAA